MVHGIDLLVWLNIRLTNDWGSFVWLTYYPNTAEAALCFPFLWFCFSLCLVVVRFDSFGVNKDRKAVSFLLSGVLDCQYQTHEMDHADWLRQRANEEESITQTNLPLLLSFTSCHSFLWFRIAGSTSSELFRETGLKVRDESETVKNRSSMWMEKRRKPNENWTREGDDIGSLEFLDQHAVRSQWRASAG